MIRKDKLAEIIENQRRWITGIDTGTEREYLEKAKFTEDFALVISGIRRCGKSTFLGQVLRKQKNFYFLNLEDPNLTGFELSDFSTADKIFREKYGEGGVYFFDEIQNVSEWERFVRHLVDRKENVMITGSNASLLSRELGAKLTGRYLRMEMYPFSYSEFLRFFDMIPSKESYEKYLRSGGFPQFLKTKDPSILHELLTNIVIRDVAVRFGIKNIDNLKKLAVYLISHTGSEFSYNSLKKMFGIKSVQSVIDYISYFEDAYLIFRVPRFRYSYRQQQVSRQKIYSIDNGLSLANSVSFSKDVGRMLENSVFLSLRRKYSDIFYYRGEGECDFVVKKKNKIAMAFQVCYNMNDENEKREINGLKEAMDKFSLNTGLILTYNQDDEITTGGKSIVVKPVWKWLTEEKRPKKSE